MTDKEKNGFLLARIQRLTAEEDALLERDSLEESTRLATIQVELDQCWDLLRQRRALRVHGQDPAQAQARPREVVKKYLG